MRDANSVTGDASGERVAAVTPGALEVEAARAAVQAKTRAPGGLSAAARDIGAVSRGGLASFALGGGTPALAAWVTTRVIALGWLP